MSALHQREDVSVQLLFQRLHSESSISCLHYLSAPPGPSLCFAFWPGRWGRALRRCSWCAGCVCEGSGTSQHWEAAKSFRLTCWDCYSVVEVGLGGWFSGEQSSVGEGRSSESSLSRWPWGTVWSTIWKTVRRTDCSVNLWVEVDDTSLLLSALLQTCLSLAASLSWWLIMALCSRHEDGPSNSRDLPLDFISCFCIKWAIS